jgi:hypothetical protein
MLRPVERWASRDEGPVAHPKRIGAPEHIVRGIQRNIERRAAGNTTTATNNAASRLDAELALIKAELTL